MNSVGMGWQVSNDQSIATWPQNNDAFDFETQCIYFIYYLFIIESCTEHKQTNKQNIVNIMVQRSAPSNK